MIRTMLNRRLRQLGYFVVIAYDGEHGFALALTERPELIVMDVGLPGMDGLQATRLLKSSDHTRHIPIIVLTEYGRPQTRKKVLAAGCDDYANKPISFTKLNEMIKNLLAETKGASALSRRDVGTLGYARR